MFLRLFLQIDIRYRKKSSLTISGIGTQNYQILDQYILKAARAIRNILQNSFMMFWVQIYRPYIFEI